MTVELLPVVECQTWPDDTVWAPPPSSDRWLTISADASDDIVGQILASVAACNDALAVTLKETLANLECCDGLIASGGLRVKALDFDLLPSCCCGLEGWRDWYSVKPGGESPWLGHDPSPHVDCQDCVAVIWTDEAGTSSEALTTPYAELSVALATADAALTGFVDRLEQWLSARSPGSERFSKTFASAFDIRIDATP
jgi:hypothetical protein